MAFEVQTEAFQGPFDLLLHLILRDEIDLYEVSLAGIVDSYLVEIESMELCDLEVATEFLLIAATLVELKCRRLLPVDETIDLDEELGLWEERDLLLSRLLECKTFKDAAVTIEQLAAAAARSAPRVAGIEDRFAELAPDLLAGIEADDIRRAFMKVAAPRPEPEVSLSHVTLVTASVSSAIEELLDRLPQMGRCSFRHLTATCDDRLEVVVRFLAALELFKQGLVEIHQPALFGDLILEWNGNEEDVELVLAGADRYEG